MSRVDPNYRNRKLLDAVHQLPCTFALPGVCEGGLGEPCHSNFARHGKGKSMKAHDCYVASGCRSCHREVDQGMRMSREERVDAWQRAFEKTLLLLWERKLIEVSNGRGY